MTGMEYVLSDVMEPHLFVMRKQKRTNPEKADPLLAYYILDGSIYQAPLLGSVFASRIVKLQSLLFYFSRNSAVRFYSSLTDNDGTIFHSHNFSVILPITELQSVRLINVSPFLFL